MLLIDEPRQAAFARLSGDHNPLHVDYDFARRSQFGGCVVHGVHLVLAALESLELDGPFRLVRLDAQFRAAVLVGESVELDVAEAADGAQQVSVLVDDHVRAVITLETAPIDSVGSVAAPPPWSTVPVETSDFDELVAIKGQEPLVLDDASFAQLFPGLAGTLAIADAATLAGTTRVVGMRCPGRWALFRRLQWTTAEEVAESPGADETALTFEVADERRRFSMLTLGLSAGDRRVEAETIVREPPPQQASMDQVREHVTSTEFVGMRALVIGGSRGLGEITAKALAAGGAQVLLTYRSGVDDAHAVAAEIGGDSDVLQLDIENLTAESIDRIRHFAPTHLSYFATPVIAKRPPGSWDADVYARFVRIYVTGLSEVLSLVDDAGALESVVFPSTIFIEDPPVGFAEYVAAKVAGEELCCTWQRLRPDHEVIIERFPPLVTDQTAARVGSDTGTNLTALLPVLRRLKR